MEQSQAAFQEVVEEAKAEVQAIVKDIHAQMLESNNILMLQNRDGSYYVDDKTSNEIADTVIDEYKIDLTSLDGWREELKEAHNLARQLRDNRTYAGEKTSDIKYPIIATACIQFQARAMPAIVKGGNVVKAKVVGSDPAGAKAARGERVSQYMSWQLADDNPHWVPDMDGLLMGLPLWGVMFKKTYHDNGAGKNDSDTIYPEDLVVNYFAKDFEPRATHKIYLYPNQIRERINTGAFIDFDYGEATNSGDERLNDEEQQGQRSEDDPHLFLEQHRWWDLDGDGYKEPYIVTVHWDSGTVVRISARWCNEDVKYDDEGNVVRIKPFACFTKFPFMPAFDGSFYCMGFGRLLSPINAAIDTLLNQLIDSGKYQNRPAGFIGSNVRLGKNQGSVKFKAGEWKKVKNVGTLRENIFQLNFGEPSTVLFQTLGLLMEASNRLASMSDVLAGEVPKGDIPATTTLSIIEQGLKVYTAVHKRIHRALKDEFGKLRRLNRIYSYDVNGQPSQLSVEYRAVIDDNADAHMDFNASDYDIVPVSSEADVSDTMRTLKADALMQHRGTGLNDQEITKRWLEAHGFEETEKITEAPPQPPDPEIELRKQEIEIERERVRLEKLRLWADAQEGVFKQGKMWAEMINKLADAESKEAGTQMQQYSQFASGVLAAVQEFARQIGGSLGGQVQPGAVQDMGGSPDNAGVPANPEMGVGYPGPGMEGGGMAAGQPSGVGGAV